MRSQVTTTISINTYLQYLIRRRSLAQFKMFSSGRYQYASPCIIGAAWPCAECFLEVSRVWVEIAWNCSYAVFCSSRKLCFELGFFPLAGEALGRRESFVSLRLWFCKNVIFWHELSYYGMVWQYSASIIMNNTKLDFSMAEETELGFVKDSWKLEECTQILGKTWKYGAGYRAWYVFIKQDIYMTLEFCIF